jgi:hypothetical protein
LRNIGWGPVTPTGSVSWKARPEVDVKDGRPRSSRIRSKMRLAIAEIAAERDARRAWRYSIQRVDTTRPRARRRPSAPSRSSNPAAACSKNRLCSSIHRE